MGCTPSAGSRSTAAPRTGIRATAPTCSTPIATSAPSGCCPAGGRSSSTACAYKNAAAGILLNPGAAGALVTDNPANENGSQGIQVNGCHDTKTFRIYHYTAFNNRGVGLKAEAAGLVLAP